MQRRGLVVTHCQHNTPFDVGVPVKRQQSVGVIIEMLHKTFSLSVVGGRGGGDTCVVQFIEGLILAGY